MNLSPIAIVPSKTNMFLIQECLPTRVVVKGPSSGQHYINFKIRCNTVQMIICTVLHLILKFFNGGLSRSQWPRFLRRRSAAARLLGLWVRIPPRVWMFVSCECIVLSGRGLCVGLITRPQESYRLWCV